MKLKIFIEWNKKKIKHTKIISLHFLDVIINKIYVGGHVSVNSGCTFLSTGSHTPGHNAYYSWN